MFGFGQYVNEFLAVPSITFGPLGLTGAKIIALAGATLFILINYIGAKETGSVQNIIVITLVAILVVFTSVGALNADLATLRPIAPNGFGPFLPVTGLVLVSYLGFVQITSVAEEIQNPGKNLPRAVIGSVVLVTTIYALVLLAVLAAVPNEVVAGNETAVVEVARILLGPIGAATLLFAGLLATASSANASILASSRINFAMGRNRLITPNLNAVHPRFRTPYRSIALTGGFILLFLFVGNLELLATAGSVLHLYIYGLLNIALIVMREAEPAEYTPDYRVPLYPATPIVGAILSFALVAFIEPVVIVLSFILIVFAIMWYYFYARSRVLQRGILTDYILRKREKMPETAVSAASSIQPDGGEFRVLVPLANPEHEQNLIALASTIAKQRNGTVEAIHIVSVPDQTALEQATEQIDEFAPDSESLLAMAQEHAETYGVSVETQTVFSHYGFTQIFEAARTHNSDLVVMGWGEHGHARAERRTDELTGTQPCDFLVMRDRGFDPSRIVVPTAGGPDSDFIAEVVRDLRNEHEADVRLLHVADNSDTGRQFLEDWAAEHDLDDVTLQIATGDVESAIQEAAKDATLLILGATERGLLTRLVSGSVVMNVIEDVDCSVLLAERAHRRSLLERLFGR